MNLPSQTLVKLKSPAIWLTRRFTVSSILVLLAMVTTATGLRAASGTWNGTTSTAWSLAGNWSASPAPGTGDTATFNNAGNARTTLDLGAGVTVNTLLFTTASAAAYTIGSGAVNSQTLTLNDSGAVTMNSTVTNGQLVNATLTLGTAAAATYTLTDSSTTSSLTFAGNIQGGTGGTAGVKTLNIGGASSGSGAVISGTIANGGASALAVTTGSGVVTFSGSNSFTGPFTVNNNANGSVTLANNNAFAGCSGVNFNANNGSPLYLAAGTTISGVTLTNTSGGNGAFGVSGNGLATWDGNITNISAGWGNPARYGPNSVSGTFVLGTSAGETMSCPSGMKIDWNQNGAGSTIVNSTITGGPFNSGNFGVRNGTLYLNCTNNSFTAPTIDITGGTLVVSNLPNQGLNSSIGSGAASGVQVINNGGGSSTTLKYLGTGDTCNRTLNLTGGAGSAGAVIDQSGSGTLTLTGAITNGANKLTLLGSTAAVGIIANGIINGTSNNRNLAKTGTGTWILNGVNTYSGTTAVNGGTLLVNGSLGTNTVIVQGTAATSQFATFGGTGTVGGAVTYGSSYCGWNSHALFTLGSPMTFLSSLIIVRTDVHLILSNNVPAGSYTLATYNTSGSSGSFIATPIIDSGSLAPNATATVTTGSGKVTLVVTANPDSTTTTLAASGNPSVVGSPVTFTAALQTANGNPAAPATGNFVFKVDGSAMATNAITVGQATYTNNVLSVGTHTITAVYQGDANYLSSTGNLAETISATALATATLLNSSANPSALGSSVAFTATVQTSNGNPAGLATGNCVFKVDGAAVATNAVSGGQAAYSTSTLTLGSHTITAIYQGNANYLASTNTFTQAVNFGTTVALGSSLNPSTNGQSVTFTATVRTNGITASGATGSMVFSADGVALATNNISGGQATYNTSILAVGGAHTITATYSGDANYLPATGSLSQVVNGTVPVFVNGIGAWVEDPSIPDSTNFTLTANGVNIPVTAWQNLVATPEQDVARFAATGSWTAVVTCAQTITNYSIRPRSRNIVGTLSGSGGLFNNVLTFTVSRPDNLYILINNLAPMFVFALPQLTPPAAGALIISNGVQNLNVGVASGQTVWLSPGCYGQGNIIANSVSNARIAGYGILQGPGSAVLVQYCSNVMVEGITEFSTPYSVSLCRTIQSTNVTWNNFCTIGAVEVREACVNVVENNCVFRSVDDAVAIKTTTGVTMPGPVTFQGCTSMTWGYGDAFTVGFESFAPKYNITFTNCDVIGSSGHGALTVEVSGSGWVSDVTFDNIRCEDLVVNPNIELQVTDGTAYGNGIPGSLTNVLCRNIACINAKPVNVLGYTNANMINGVTFENCSMAGSILTASYSGLVTNVYVTNLVFTTSSADALPPTVSITAPTNGASSPSNALVVVSAQITDNAGVTNGQLFVDGISKGNDTAAPYSWTVTNLSVGAHTLTVVGNNLFGLTATNSVSLTVSPTADATVPVVVLTYPTNGASIPSSSPLNVVATITDNATVLNGQLYIDGVLNSADPTAPYTWTLYGVSTGSHTLSVVGVDTSGNMATNSISVSIYYQYQPANGVWVNTLASGQNLWSGNTNWANAVIADGADNTADFSQVDITANMTVHMDAPHTLSTVIFGDANTASAASWILDNNGNAANILTLTGNPIIQVNTLGTGASAIVSAGIAGTYGLTVSGTGPLVLAGSNTYSGVTMFVDNGAGSLTLSNNAALGNSSWMALNANNGAPLYLGAGTTITGIPLIIGAAGNAAFGVSGSGTATWDGDISSSQTPWGNPFRITPSSSSGTLVIGSNASRTISFPSGMKVDWNQNGAGSTIVNSTIAGGPFNSGSFHVAQGTLYLNNTNNSFTAPTIDITGLSVLVVSNLPNQGVNSSIGYGAVSGTQIVNLGGGSQSMLRYVGMGDTCNRTIAAQGSAGGYGACLDMSGSGTLTLNGAITNGANQMYLQGSTAGIGQITSGIMNGTNNNRNLVKAGTGIWILGGTNTYSGTTTVNGGTLLVNGVIGTNTVTVNSSASFGGGGGTVGGVVTYNAGSHAVFTNGDTMTFSNSLVIASSGTIPDVHLQFSNNVPGGSYTLATYNPAGSSGTFGSTPVIDLGSLIPNATAKITNGAGNVVLVVTPPTNTTTTVNSSLNPSLLTSNVTFTVTIAPASGATVPTGTVQFQTNGVNFGSPVTVTTGVSPNGTSAISITNLPAGTNTITANFIATGNFASSSGTLAGGQVVNALVTTPPNFSGGRVSLLPGGGISLVATGAVGGKYSLWAGTNLALTPFTNYAKLLVTNGTIIVSPFTNFDLTATNYPQRFYLFTTP